MIRARVAAAILATILAATAAPVSLGSDSPKPLRVELMWELDSLDPALAYLSWSWQIEYATCVKLLNYPDYGSLGNTPVPEAALTVPIVSRDGKTVSLVVPPGRFRFSPPSNEPVTADSFRRAFERSLGPAGNPASAGYMSDLVGLEAFRSGTSSSISGISVLGPLLTMRFTTPVEELPQLLALPFFCAVPGNAPAPGTTVVLPSAGPYYVSTSDLFGTTTLLRNPNYNGPRPRRFKQIDVVANVPQADILSHVQSGAADYSPGTLAPDAYAGLAPLLDTRLFVNPSASIQYLRFNTTRPVFASAAARQAVNLVLDRTVLASRNGAFGSVPTDQILPPGVPGFVDRDIYPLAGPTAAQLAQARTLLGPGFAATVELVVGPNALHLQRAQDIVAQLAPLGFTVNVTSVPFGVLNTIPPPYTWDLVLNAWSADFLDPSNFVNAHLGSSNPNNIGGFVDPVLSPAMDAAARLTGTARTAAYANLDLWLMRDAAPLAPYANLADRDFFSTRVGCPLHTTLFGMSLGALCPR